MVDSSLRNIQDLWSEGETPYERRFGEPFCAREKWEEALRRAVLPEELVPLAEGSKSCLKITWEELARIHRVRLQLWRVSGQCYALNTGYGLPCNTYTVTLGIWVMNVPIMPLHLVHLASFPATTLPLAGFVKTLTHLVVMVETASARFWKDCIALELKQRCCLKVGVSAVFIIGFFMSLTYTLRRLRFCSQPFFSRASTAMESPTSCASTALSSGENFAHNMWNPLLELLFHEQMSGDFVLYVEGIDLAKIALSCHFAFDLLCYKEVVHDSVWCFIGHHCPWNMSIRTWHHCHACDIEILNS